MYHICKKWCNYREEVCEVGDVLLFDQLGKYPKDCFLKIECKLGFTNIATRGHDHATVCASNLAFHPKKHDTAADDFVILYSGFQIKETVFWSVEVTNGEKAILKVLDANEAEKLFDELPRQVFNRDYLFD